MVGFEFSLSSCEFGGRNYGRINVYLSFRASLHAFIDELIVNWYVNVCIHWLRKPSFGRR